MAAAAPPPVHAPTPPPSAEVAPPPPPPGKLPSSFIGCFRDKRQGALPVLLGKEVTVDKCREVARGGGLLVFGIQS